MPSQKSSLSSSAERKPIPITFYRYVDESSWNQFHHHNGFMAPPSSISTQWSDRLNSELIRKHLDWENKTPTGLVGLTTSNAIAYSVARSRVRDGRRNVRIYEGQSAGYAVDDRGLARFRGYFRRAHSQRHQERLSLLDGGGGTEVGGQARLVRALELGGGGVDTSSDHKPACSSPEWGNHRMGVILGSLGPLIAVLNALSDCSHGESSLAHSRRILRSRRRKTGHHDQSEETDK